MAFTPYSTFDEFVAWTQLGGSAKASVVENVNMAVTRAIDEYCQRHFWQDGTVGTPVARTFEPCNTRRVDLGPFNDLLSITTLKTDEAGDGTFETTWAASDYQLLPYNRPTGRPYTSIEVVGGRLFPIRYSPSSGRRDRVQITGIWGWGVVPADVKQAHLIKAARVFTRHQSPQGIATGLGDFGIRISRFEDPDVVSLLEPYRRTAVLVA